MDRSKLEKLFAKNAEVKDLEARAKEARAEYEILSAEIIADMEDHDIKSSQKFNGLGHCTLAKPRLFASIQNGEQDRAFDFVRSNGFGELIKEQINPSSLSSVISSLMEQGVEVPECFSIFLKQSLRLYKSKE